MCNQILKKVQPSSWLASTFNFQLSNQVYKIKETNKKKQSLCWVLVLNSWSRAERVRRKRLLFVGIFLLAMRNGAPAAVCCAALLVTRRGWRCSTFIASLLYFVLFAAVPSGECWQTDSLSSIASWGFPISEAWISGNPRCPPSLSVQRSMLKGHGT